MAAARVHRPPRHPDGGYFVGQSALVSLSGAAPRDAVLRPVVAQHARFSAVAGAGLPAGPDGRRRPLPADAARRRLARPAGEGVRGAASGRPAAAVRPVPWRRWPGLEGKLPVVFEADTARRDPPGPRLRRRVQAEADHPRRPRRLEGRRPAEGDRTCRSSCGSTSPSRTSGRSNLPARAARTASGSGKEEVACAGELHKAGVRFAFATQGLPATGRRRSSARTCARRSPPGCRPTRRWRP